jgi:uncharacterized membrane protein
MSVFYMIGGVAHLASADKFLQIVPDWVSFPRVVVCEIASSVALASTPLRRLAGIMLALYAVCVLPANVKHVIDDIYLSPMPDSWWYHGPQLAFQPVLVWWALWCAGVINWPFPVRAGSNVIELGDRIIR